MYDGGKIILGLLVFLVVVTFPIWFPVARGESGAPPDVVKPASGQCVLADSLEMRETHMTLLNTWRDEVVRGGERFYEYTDKEGTTHRVEKSLTNTCLNCHSNKAEFCDRCHDYVDIKPYCWDCHIDKPAGEE